MWFQAKIVKLMTFGAFAEIIPGVDGLIHISQIADRRINKPDDVLSEGQDVDCEDHRRGCREQADFSVHSRTAERPGRSSGRGIRQTTYRG